MTIKKEKNKNIKVRIKINYIIIKYWLLKSKGFNKEIILQKNWWNAYFKFLSYNKKNGFDEKAIHIFDIYLVIYHNNIINENYNNK